jgi:hypothetical protein
METIAVNNAPGQQRWRANCGLRFVHRVWRQAERGEDTSFEFVAAIGPIVIMILTIAFVVVVRASQMPAWSAAANCARAAVATLDESIGRQQALNAAQQSLLGNSINATNSQIAISGNWSPGAQVTCRVSYDVDVSWIGLFAEMMGGKVPVQASVTMSVEPYKSNWN